MKKWLVFIILVLMLSWTIYEGVGDTPSNNYDEALMMAEGPIQVDPDTGLQKGQLAPDFTLSTLDGGEVTLSEFKGEKVMLNFWATWCPPCRAEMPDMEKFHEQHDIKVLAVNLTDSESSERKVEEFVDEYNLSFTVLMDTQADVKAQYQIIPVPTSIFIDEEGRVQSVVKGAMNYDMMVQRYRNL
ncbi:redoxin domain-containing protein [Halobacillus fulvus]|nr:redoxin domain-containing protein [Halobacillus fulvus]